MPPIVAAGGRVGRVSRKRGSSALYLAESGVSAARGQAQKTQVTGKRFTHETHKQNATRTTEVHSGDGATRTRGERENEEERETRERNEIE